MTQQCVLWIPRSQSDTAQTTSATGALSSGMLIAWLEKRRQENAGEMGLANLEGFYRDAKKH
ncbi:arginine--tRNA ligase [Escherichia coli]